MTVAGSLRFLSSTCFCTATQRKMRSSVWNRLPTKLSLTGLLTGSFQRVRRIRSSKSLLESMAFGQIATRFRRAKTNWLRHDRTVGSHKIMKKDGWADYPFSFHDGDELGPSILAKIAKRLG